MKKCQIAMVVLVAMTWTIAEASHIPSSDALRPEALKAMTLEQLLEEGENLIQDMNSMVSSVLDTMQSARAEKDFERMNNIGTVLSNMKALLRVSGQNAVTLREQVINRDRNGSQHEYVKIRIAHQRVRELLEQARSVGGPSADVIFEGAPIVERNFDSDLPGDDIQDALVEIVNLDPPPSASPFF